MLLVTSASDLLLHSAYKLILFCFLLLVVVVLAGCGKDSLMRACLFSKLHGGCSQLLFALHQSSINIQLFVENCDFYLPTCIQRPHWGGGSSEYCHNVWYGKLEWCGYPMVKKF